MRTWAPTTPNVRGVASSLGCGTTVRAACGRGLAVQLGLCMWKGPELLIMVRSACSAQTTYGSAVCSGRRAVREREESSHRSESHRCRFSIASREVMRDCNHRSRLSQFWWTSRFFSRRCGLSSDGGVDTSACGGSCSSVWEYFAWYNLWFPGVGHCWWIPLQRGVRRTARSGVNGTMRVQACFAALWKKPIFEIGPALSLLPTSWAMPHSDLVFAFGTCGE